MEVLEVKKLEVQNNAHDMVQISCYMPPCYSITECQQRTEKGYAIICFIVPQTSLNQAFGVYLYEIYFHYFIKW